LSSDLQGEHPDLGTLLDAWTAKQDEQWRVTDRGYVEHYSRPTSPTWVLAPGFSLGTEASEYVSHLAGIRLDVLTVTTPSGSASTRRVVAVPEVGDDDAAAKWGYRSDVVDLTELGTISEAFAQSILNGMRKRGRHRFGWTGSLLVRAGQLLGPYGAPARLSMPRGGDVVRVPRFWDDTQDYANHLYADLWDRPGHPASRRRHRRAPARRDGHSGPHVDPEVGCTAVAAAGRPLQGPPQGLGDTHVAIVTSTITGQLLAPAGAPLAGAVAKIRANTADGLLRDVLTGQVVAYQSRVTADDDGNLTVSLPSSGIEPASPQWVIEFEPKLGISPVYFTLSSDTTWAQVISRRRGPRRVGARRRAVESHH
jgi:hypothetical protein